MVSLRIEDVKLFMEKLFASDLFDRFEVQEATVKTLFTSQLSGRINADWLDTDEKEQVLEFATWSKMKPLVYDMIKGKKTPLLMVIHFSYLKENQDRTGIRIQYEKEELRLITGYNSYSFTMDKSPEYEWDEQVAEFLHKQGIVTENEI